MVTLIWTLLDSVTTLKLTNAAGAVDVSNLATSDTIEIVRGGATQDSTLTFKAAGVTGTADLATVTIAGMTAGADLAFAGAVETMTINVTADTSIADLDLMVALLRLPLMLQVVIWIRTNKLQMRQLRRTL